jgi:small subunit ribosomal protein S1
LVVKKSSNKKSAPKSMEELLAQSGFSIKTFELGEPVDARIISIDPKSVTLDIGGKSEGIIVGSNFDEAKSFIRGLKVGDKVHAVVVDPEASDGMVRLSLRQSATDAIWKNLEEIKKKGKEVEVFGKNVTDKGIVVEFQSTTGFIPTSQLSKKALKNTQKLLETPFKVKVVEADKIRNRVVFSEKAVTEGEEMELQNKAISNLKEGEIYDGVVKDVTSFGIFVEIIVNVEKSKIPVEGLVHISEISWEKTEDPKTEFSVGDKVKVIVLGTKDGKLNLSIKHAKKDPWDDVDKKYSVDQKIKAKVVKRSGFGVFVELEPGIEGLIHITKIPPGTELKKGDEAACYIEEVNKEEKRISLGLILTSKPVGYK